MAKSVFRAGSGEPMVLIHIGSDPWHKWEPVLPRLTDRFDVLAPTLPGWAGGPTLNGPASMSMAVDAMETAMDQAGFETAHLVGNSMGGWIAFELARRGRARTVLAFSPAGGWNARGRRRLTRFFVWNSRLSALTRPFVPLVMRFASLRRIMFRLIVERGDQMTRQQAVDLTRDTMKADWPRLLPLITDETVTEYPDLGVPSLIVWSERDRFTPLKFDGKTWSAAAPHAEFRILPDVGHMPMFDDPTVVADTIIEHASAR
ncbi:MAG: alpha/beta fold hydrolase [Aeromicrobium sp.]